MSKLILASSSERRRELLSWVGVPFEVVEPEFDESVIACEDPEELVMTLAMEKARVVAEKLGNEGMGADEVGILVLGSDTMVVVEQEGGWDVVGKPRDVEDAKRILDKLRGRSHWVYTGVAVIEVDTGECRVEVERSEVRFRRFSDKELVDYVATGEPMGKAGAYAYQGGAGVFVEGIEGSVTGVIGLPLKRTVEMLKEFTDEWRIDTERIVWQELGYRD